MFSNPWAKAPTFDGRRHAEETLVAKIRILHRLRNLQRSSLDGDGAYG